MVGEPNPTISHKNKNAKTPGIGDSRFLRDAGLDELDKKAILLFFFNLFCQSSQHII
jgi:hypothetical protein